MRDRAGISPTEVVDRLFSRTILLSTAAFCNVFFGYHPFTPPEKQIVFSFLRIMYLSYQKRTVWVIQTVRFFESAGMIVMFVNA